MNFYNRVKFTTTTTGTGTLTVGSAVSKFRTPAQASIPNATIVRYVIEEGSNWETGYGTYTVSGTTLSRNVLQSSNSDALITLAGAAVVRITILAEDIPVVPATINATDISGCINWIDMNQESGADGDTIGTLTDRSTSANNCTQGTTANKPLLKLNVANGRKGAFFDGSNDYLTYGATINAPTTHTILIVCAPQYKNTYSPPFAYKQQTIYSSMAGTAFWGIYRSGDNYCGVVEGGQPQVLGLWGNSNTDWSFIHNYLKRPGTNVNGFQSFATSYIGTDVASPGSQVFSGHFFELRVYDTKISETNLYNSIDYLLYKWRGLVRNL